MVLPQRRPMAMVDAVPRLPKPIFGSGLPKSPIQCWRFPAPRIRSAPCDLEAIALGVQHGDHSAGPVQDRAQPFSHDLPLTLKHKAEPAQVGPKAAGQSPRQGRDDPCACRGPPAFAPLADKLGRDARSRTRMVPPPSQREPVGASAVRPVRGRHGPYRISGHAAAVDRRSCEYPVPQPCPRRTALGGGGRGPSSSAGRSASRRSWFSACKAAWAVFGVFEPVSHVGHPRPAAAPDRQRAGARRRAAASQTPRPKAGLCPVGSDVGHRRNDQARKSVRVTVRPLPAMDHREMNSGQRRGRGLVPPAGAAVPPHRPYWRALSQSAILFCIARRLTPPATMMPIWPPLAAHSL
ncbi:hypothetical protein SAMN06265378_11837 [Paracoccus sediminis]|uniref:Uncharacterized protein n=1 Tax=Paracoccus sediminis TaxID=1214787 RepID=A0A238YGL1_9RHOB|nr:hypothetical protein SAMN06265378_11837 [Paracoccus sediminis]